jgi:guanidinopropionase
MQAAGHATVNSVIPQKEARHMAHPDTTPFQPILGTVLPRFAGIATFMRLPHLGVDEARGRVEIGLVGVPWDGSTTNRPGTRHGPRQLRDQSTMMRQVHHVSGIEPYRLAACADLGDIAVNPADQADTLARIELFYETLRTAKIVPLSAGGDHLISLPILRALAADGPLGMVHIDAHTDTSDRYFGDYRYTHGTPFRRAIEEGKLDPKRVVQIGIRGSMNTADEKDWGAKQGIRVIEMEELQSLGIEAVIAQAREVVGDRPAYLSFDIDALDPSYAPGTGTPEIGGLTSREAQQLIRGLRGVDFVGADVVEVSPPFDQSGSTALIGVTVMFEILCLLAERVAGRRIAG